MDEKQNPTYIYGTYLYKYRWWHAWYSNMKTTCNIIEDFITSKQVNYMTRGFTTLQKNWKYIIRSLFVDWWLWYAEPVYVLNICYLIYNYIVYIKPLYMIGKTQIIRIWGWWQQTFILHTDFIYIYILSIQYGAFLSGTKRDVSINGASIM
jgi:hypothetical protein